MSNQVYRTDTFDTWRVKTNDTSKVLGEVTTLDSRITLTTLVFKGATANSFSVGNTVTGSVTGATATVDSIVDNVLTVIPTNANTFVGGDVVKSRIYLSGAGDLTVGSTITGATSSKTAKVFSFNAVENSAVIYNVSGAFTVGETLTATSKTITAVSYNTIVDIGETISNGTNSRELETASKTAISGINELQRDIGTVANLATAEKTNLVGALNEVKDSAITFNGAKTFSESLNLASTKVFTIAGTSVLSATTLGDNVVNSSLTKVGTIATGVWQGTIVGPTYGGTGVNNGSRTITLNTGNLTLTANVAGSVVTIPATGTLATLAGSETLTNKTITLGTNTLTGTLAQFNTSLTDDDFAGLAAAQTLTNKSIALGSNTITGTLAQFNTALTDDDFVALAASQTLTNKSLVDSSTFIVDELDSTKKLQFQVSGITTNTTRTLTAPNFDGTLATLAGSETLTNKTITLGANSITGTLTQFNASLTDDDFAGLATAQTLTNKSIALGSNTVTGTLAQFNTALTDDDFAALAATQTLTNKTVNLANNTLTGTLAQFNTALSDDDFAGLATAQTLTNKSIALGSNTVTGTLAQFNASLTDDDFVAIGAPQTLTNKSLTDANFFVIDDAAATKRARFESSGITAGQTRIQTFQDRDGTLAHLDNVTFIGTTSVSLSRTSANLALTGISSVTFPGSTSGSVVLQAVATAGTSTISLPANTTGTVVTTGDSGTVTSAMILDGTIVNADINAAAAIAYGKLSLGNSIVNADIATGAAIANSKIAGLAASATTDTTNASNISSGTLADGRIAAALTGKTYNGLTISTTTGTLTVTNAKTLSVTNTLTLSGTDGSTLNIGGGGTLGSAAYTSTGAYSPLIGSGSITTLGTVTTGIWQASSIGTAYTDAKITSVTGTANRVLVTGTGAITLSLPQDIHSTATPTFGGLTLTRNQATGSPAGSTAVNVVALTNSTFATPNRFTINSDGSVVIEGDLTVKGNTAITSTTYSPAWSSVTAGAGFPSPTYNVALTGDVSGSTTTTAAALGGNVAVSVASTLANSGVTAGTYTKVAVNAKGLVTTGATLSAGDIPALDYLSNSATSTQNGYFNDVYLWDTTNPSHYLAINNSSDLTVARTLNINVNDADRTISLSGNLTVSGAATVSGTNTGDQTIQLTGDVGGSGTGSIVTTITNNAVTTVKILDANVTAAKLGDGSVTEAKIGTGAVTTTKIGDLQVTTAKIADGNVTNAKLATGIDIAKLSAYTFTVNGSSGLSAGGTANLGGAVSLQNTDKGSDQLIFKNIAVSGQTTIAANSNSTTLTVVAGQVDSTSGITLSTDNTTKTLTISHANTSSQATSSNTGSTVIQSVTLDTYGHVTGLTTVDTNTANDLRFVRLSAANQTITGNIAIQGNFTVSGAYTTVLSQTVEIEDANILLAKTATNATLANGAGFTIGNYASNPTFSYSSAGDRMVLNRPIEATSFVVTGGMPSQFLKANGTVDSNSYLTSETDTLGSVTGRNDTTTNSIVVGTNGGIGLGANRTGKSSIYQSSTAGLSFKAVTGSTYGFVFEGAAGQTVFSEDISGVNAGRLVINRDGYATHIAGVLTTASSVTATSFIKSGGSGSEFLKANGTVDSTTYLSTTGSAAGLTNFPTLNQSTTGNAATASQTVATVAGTGSIELVRGNMADNDQFRILVGGTASNAGFVEIATADDGNEPIYVRQYNGVFTTLARTLTLLDASGNTSAPGAITASSFVKSGGTSSQFLKADGSVDGNTYATTGQIPSVGNGAFNVSISGTAATSGQALQWGTSTGFTANASGASTYDLRVGPALSNYATAMSGASNYGFLKKTGADTVTRTLDFSGGSFDSIGIVFQSYSSANMWTVLHAGDPAGLTELFLPNGSGTLARTSDISNHQITIQGGTGMSGGGSFGLNQGSIQTITLTNSDPGSSQNIFKNVALSGAGTNSITCVADSNNDTLTLSASSTSGIAISADATTDTITFTNTGVRSITANLVPGNGVFSGAGTINFTGTANQVHLDSSGTTLTFSAPQNIHTGATPTFAGAILTGLSGYVKANGASALTASSTIPSTDISNSTFADLSSNQTLGGVKTFSSEPQFVDGINIENMGIITGIRMRTGSGGGATTRFQVIYTSSNPRIITGTGNGLLVYTNGGSNLAMTLTSAGNITAASSVRVTTALNVGSGAALDTFGADGEIRAMDNVTAYYTSDARLKTNVKKIDNALQKVAQINGVTFDWNETYLEKHGDVDGYFVRNENSGVIAQEVESVFPNVVADRADGFKAVRYELLVPLLIEAIKDLKAEIEALKAQK